MSPFRFGPRARRIDAGPPAALVAPLAIVLVVAWAALPVDVGAVLAADCWRAPVVGEVADPYREPPCRWCAGNRGITYRAEPRAAVRAVAGGTVTYAGSVAGTLYVVVRHADGRRATYGDLGSTTVSVGNLVVARQIVGRARPGTGDDPITVHFGLRGGDDPDGDEYVDPTPLIGELVGRPRLVPLDGSAPAPAPPPRLRCGASPE